jgi:hypothetical protein
LYFYYSHFRRFVKNDKAAFLPPEREKMPMEDLAVKLQEVKDRSLRNEGRIKQLEVDQRALNELALSVKELATDQTNMKEDIGEIKANVRSLTAVPSKRWEKVVELMIATVVGAFMAWLLTGGAV